MPEQPEQQRREESIRPGRFQKIVDACIAGIPLRHVINLGKMLGALVYFVDVPHRRIVRRNLQFVHPHWSMTQVNITSKRIFQNDCGGAQSDHRA